MSRKTKIQEMMEESKRLDLLCLVVKVPRNKRASLAEQMGKDEDAPGVWKLAAKGVPEGLRGHRSVWFITPTTKGDEWVIIASAGFERVTPVEGSRSVNVEFIHGSVLPPSMRPRVDASDVPPTGMASWGRPEREEWNEAADDAFHARLDELDAPREMPPALDLGAQAGADEETPNITTHKGAGPTARRVGGEWVDELREERTKMAPELERHVRRAGGEVVPPELSEPLTGDGSGETMPDFDGALEREGVPVLVVDTPDVRAPLERGDDGRTYVAIGLVDESPSNPRKNFDVDELAALGESIAESGLIQPIVVRPHPTRPGRVECVVGHRRLRATKMLTAKVIAATLLDVDDATVLELQLTENNARAGVTPLEEADAIEALVTTHGKGPEDVAGALGRPIGYVRRRRALTRLVSAVRELLEEDRLGVGGAMLLAALPDYAQLEMVEKKLCQRWDGEAQKWSVAQVRDHIGRHSCSLASVAWDMGVELAGCRACTGCPERSGAQVSLIADDADDRCLNSACYKTKHAAAGEAKAREAAKKKGLTFLPTKDRGSLYSTHYNVRENAYQAGKGDTTWGKLAPDAPVYVAPALGFDGKVSLKKYIRKEDLLAHLEEHDPETHARMVDRTKMQEPGARKRLIEEQAAQRERAMEWARNLDAEGAVGFLLEQVMDRYHDAPAQAAPLREKLAWVAGLALRPGGYNYADQLAKLSAFAGVDFAQEEGDVAPEAAAE